MKRNIIWEKAQKNKIKNNKYNENSWNKLFNIAILLLYC